jgi:hypothetical protein
MKIENISSRVSTPRSLNFVSARFDSLTYSKTALAVLDVRSVKSEIDTSTEKKSQRTRKTLKRGLFIGIRGILSNKNRKIKRFSVLPITVHDDGPACDRHYVKSV